MIAILISAIKIIFLLGFIILIHECGHFFIAKLCKIKVTDFAIGFGPTIFQKQGKETKYSLRAIPLGGYVNMVGEQERSDEEGSFSKASIPKRISIILAGAVVNIIFGLLVYFIVATSMGNNISTVIKEIKPDYAASQVDIKVEDQILKIDGKRVRLKSDVDRLVNEAKDTKVVITIKRNGEIKEVSLIPTKEEIKNMGVYLGAEGENLSPEVKLVYPDTPAERVGIKAGDIILFIDDIEIEDDANRVVSAISESENKKIKVVVDRNGEILTFDTEVQTSDLYYLGVIWARAENTFVNNIYYGFWETVDFSISIVENLREMFSGKIGAEQLMGPVGISEVVTKTEGFKDFIFLVALISLSLGVTNLLPFPPLDGGKIVLIIIEAVRRKPLKENIEVGIQMTGFVLLIGLAIYVTYNDILRIFL